MKALKNYVKGFCEWYCINVWISDFDRWEARITL